MKQYLKPRHIVLGILIFIFCFVPVVDMEYVVVVEKQVLEPYTVLEEVREPYTDVVDYFVGWEREDIPGWDRDEGIVWSQGPEYPVTQQRWVTKYRTVIKEVTKTRLVTRPVAETRTKRVSILRYLLG